MLQKGASRHLKLYICQCALKCFSCAFCSLPHYIKNGGRHLKWEGYITLSVQRVCDIMGSFHVKARKIQRIRSIKHHVNIYTEHYRTMIGLEVLHGNGTCRFFLVLHWLLLYYILHILIGDSLECAFKKSHLYIKFKVVLIK